MSYILNVGRERPNYPAVEHCAKYIVVLEESSKSGSVFLRDLEFIYTRASYNSRYTYTQRVPRADSTRACTPSRVARLERRPVQDSIPPRALGQLH